MSQIPDLRTAVRALDGVHADVRWPDPHGPAVLRVEFADIADQQEVAAGIMRAVREVGGADLATVRLSGGDRGPAGDDRPGRAAFTGLSVDRTDLDARVTVTLAWGLRTASGSVSGLATRRAAPRTAAAAALKALTSFLPDEVRVQLEWIDVIEPTGPGRPQLVQSAVTFLSHAGEETFVGTALDRGDLREAAVRATLAALNRPMERLCEAS